MLVYNTTYHVTFDDARNFVIWIHQVYIPQALASGETLLQEMQKVFKDKAAGFTTLMEVIEEH